MQFKRGETARDLVPAGDAAILRKNKRQLAEAERKTMPPMLRCGLDVYIFESTGHVFACQNCSVQDDVGSFQEHCVV